MLWYLTTSGGVGIITNMNAEVMLKERHALSEDAFVDMTVWRLPSPATGSQHDFKYRLALVLLGLCVLRYDHEQGKGDHKHIGNNEMPYTFTTPQALLDDFWNDVDSWRT